MGNNCCSNCSESCQELILEIGCDEAQKELIHACRKLFELTDVDGDGLISLEDFVLMGLHQTKLHDKRNRTLGWQNAGRWGDLFDEGDPYGQISMLPLLLLKHFGL